MKNLPLRSTGLLALTLAACGQSPQTTSDQTGASSARLPPLLQPVPTPGERVLYTNTFDADTATTLSDLRGPGGAEGADGVPDHRQNFNPANLDPDPTSANGGSGLIPGQAQFTNDGDTQTPTERSVQVDAVSAAGSSYEGSFGSHALALADGNLGRANNSVPAPTTPAFPATQAFAAVYGGGLASGSLTLKFFEPVGSTGPLVIELGGAFQATGDHRLAASTRTLAVTLQGGAVAAAGDGAITSLGYSQGTVHTLTLRYDSADKSQGPHGIYSYQMDGGEVGHAPALTAMLPDRFSVNNGTFASTSGVKLIDDLQASRRRT